MDGGSDCAAPRLGHHGTQSYFRVGDIASHGRAEAEECVRQADPDFILVTMTQDPYRTFSKVMTPVSSRTQRGECLEYCEIAAWMMELMEYHFIRGRAMLVIQKEQNKFWTLAPCVAMNEKGSIHQTYTCLDNTPLSLFGTSDVVRIHETKVDQEMRVVRKTEIVAVHCSTLSEAI